MEMRKLLTTALILSVFTSAFAQESVYYYLPSTTITVEVEAEQETFYVKNKANDAQLKEAADFALKITK